MELEPVSRFEWERLIRRARIGATTQHLALLLATYANRDGAKVHPGIARLATVSERDPKTVKRTLVKLRDLGLLERVFEASRNGRKNSADEYRLTMPADLIEHVAMLDPDENQGTPGHPGSVALSTARGHQGTLPDPNQGTSHPPNQGTPEPPHQNTYLHHPNIEVLAVNGDRGRQPLSTGEASKIESDSWQAIRERANG